MSYLVREVYHESVNRTTLVKERLAFIIADDASSLPVDTADMVYVMGSEALTIDTGDKYIKNSSGSWILQPSSNVWQNVYTKTEVDDIVTRIDSDITDVENDVSELHSALVDVVNSGGKNKMPVASGQSTPPTRWVNVPVVLPPGTYRVSFGTLTSTDTDDQVCQACFLSGPTQVSNWISFERGTNVHSGICTITSDTTTFRLYPAGSYASSEGDTVTFDQCMICDNALWEVSPEYTPYCPTLYELYQLVKSYHP